MATASIVRRLCRPLCSAASTQQASGLSRLHSHPFSSDSESSDTSSIGNEKVQRLADDITGLTILEASWLSEILRKRLNIQKPAMGAMPMSFAMPAAAAPADAAEAPKEEKKEKTEFEVKLESFSAEGKIKVIKEIRAITSLGLKEAKELVRGLPAAWDPPAAAAALPMPAYPRPSPPSAASCLGLGVYLPCSSDGAKAAGGRWDTSAGAGGGPARKHALSCSASAVHFQYKIYAAAGHRLRRRMPLGRRACSLRLGSSS
jgi:large subunit ribosomal protein L7/L12